jgi:hypothetical protein
MTDLEDDREDHEGDHPMEMLDSTEAWLGLIDKIAVENFGALETVGGNLLFHVPGIATRLVITSGRNKGLYDEPTEDPAHFIMAVQQWALLHLLEPDPVKPRTVAELVDSGALAIEGDQAVYDRFMALGQKRRGLVSIRLQ